MNITQLDLFGNPTTDENQKKTKLETFICPVTGKKFLLSYYLSKNRVKNKIIYLKISVKQEGPTFVTVYSFSYGLLLENDIEICNVSRKVYACYHAPEITKKVR